MASSEKCETRLPRFLERFQPFFEISEAPITKELLQKFSGHYITLLLLVQRNHKSVFQGTVVDKVMEIHDLKVVLKLM